MPAESNSGDNAQPLDHRRHDETVQEFSPGASCRAAKCRILVVDADSDSRRQISTTLADLDHILIEVASTTEALSVLAGESQDLPSTDSITTDRIMPDRITIDLIMIAARVPDLGGIGFCKVLRKMPAVRLVPIFVVASSGDRGLEAQAFSAGADEFFIGPVKQSSLRARVHATLRLRSMMESLDDSESVLFSLAKSVEDRDPDLGQHCQRLALMASAMGLALGLPPAAIRSLQHGGYLHDIGKIGIPDRVLFKAGPLTPDEWEIMRSHSVRGERICACMKSLAPVLPIIRHHHEKFDGTGYPDGLKGEELPLLARILQVVDIYDALTTERSYKPAFTPDEAMSIMRDEAKKGWRDPHLVEVFADLLPLFRNPAVGDAARISLQSLAEPIERYRRNSQRQPISA